MRRLFSYSQGQTVVLYALVAIALLGAAANEGGRRGHAIQSGIDAASGGRRCPSACELSSRKHCDRDHQGHCICDGQVGAQVAGK